MPRPRPLSSRDLIRLVERHGAAFKRHGRGSHDIYERQVGNRRHVAVVITGKPTLDASYVKTVLRQLGFSDAEIEDMFSN